MQYDYIGPNLRTARKSKNLSLSALAEQMQLRGHTTVVKERLYEIEHGKRLVNHLELISLARILGVPITQLLGVPDLDTE